jgi:hypothetical protein
MENITLSKQHIQKHNDKELPGNSKSLGWFWGPMRTMLQGKPQATIAEMFGEAPVYQCGHPNRGK